MGEATGDNMSLRIILFFAFLGICGGASVKKDLVDETTIIHQVTRAEAKNCRETNGCDVSYTKTSCNKTYCHSSMFLKNHCYCELGHAESILYYPHICTVGSTQKKHGNNTVTCSEQYMHSRCCQIFLDFTSSSGATITWFVLLPTFLLFV